MAFILAALTAMLILCVQHREDLKEFFDLYLTRFYWRWALRHFNKGRYYKATQYLQRSLELSTSNYPSWVGVIADVYFLQGCALSHLSNYKGAIENLGKAAEIVSHELGEENILFADCLYNIAVNESHIGDYDASYTKLQKTIIIIQKEDSEDAVRVADCHIQMSYIEKARGNYNKALDKVEQALKIYVKTCEDTDPIVIETYSNLGSTQVFLDMYQDAEKNINKALELLHVISKKETLLFADCYYSLGIIRLKQNQFIEGRDYIERAYKIYDRELDKNNPSHQCCRDQLNELLSFLFVDFKPKNGVFFPS